MPTVTWKSARYLVFGLVLSAANCAQAAPSAAMGPEEARHLLSRTGFDAPLQRIDTYARLSRREAVERELDSVTQAARSAPPSWTGEWDRPGRVHARAHGGCSRDPSDRRL